MAWVQSGQYIFVVISIHIMTIFNLYVKFRQARQYRITGYCFVVLFIGIVIGHPLFNKIWNSLIIDPYRLVEVNIDRVTMDKF